MDPAVVITNLSVTLGDQYVALDDITLDIPAGRITGFLGPSGAGKTTLIRAIVGRQKIHGGALSVFNEPAGSPVLRSQISYMTQETSVYSDLTAAENLQYFAVVAGIARGKVSAAVQEVLGAIDMTDKADVVVSQLSGGQKQRVSLGAALLGHRRLLVLDEPTVGLDPVLREQLWALFRKTAAGGTTIIISSHVMDEASRCDNLVLIRGGKLLAHETPERLCKQTKTDSVEAAFIKLVEHRT